MEIHVCGDFAELQSLACVVARLFNLCQTSICRQNAEWDFCIMSWPRSVVAVRSLFLHHKVSGSLTKLYAGIHTDLFHNRTGYDVISCFRSTVIVTKWPKMPSQAVFGPIYRERFKTCSRNFIDLSGISDWQKRRIWRRYLLKIGCNMQLNTAH